MGNLKYAISMLLKIKDFVLSSEIGKEREQFLTLITGCGMFTIAGHIDNIVETLLEQQTALADYKYKYRLADGINQFLEDFAAGKYVEEAEASKEYAKEKRGKDEWGK